MPTVETTCRGPVRIVLLAGLAGVLGLSLPGCSGGGDPPASAADRSRAKATFQKKFQDFGEEPPIKGRR